MNKPIKLAGVAICILSVGLGIHTPAAASSIYAKCDTYINIRQFGDTNSQIIGKIYNGNIAEVLSIDGSWVQIQSGNVKGWAKYEYFSSQPIDSYTTATIYPQLLNVRTEPSEQAPLFGAVYAGDEIEAVNYENGWVTLAFPDGTYGFVDGNYVSLNTYYGVAQTLEQEQQRQEQEYLSYLAQQEYLESFVDNSNLENYSNFDYQYQENDSSMYEENINTENVSETSVSYTPSSETTQEVVSNVTEETPTQDTQTPVSQPSTSSSNTSGQAISNYAKQFIGNPYVWGGTSLSTGADCSGFTLAVMAANGITVNGRTAADQAAGGTKVSLKDAQAGDIIYYDNGSGVYHVAIYNGDGTVTHSSNSVSGVKISDLNYSGNAAGAVRYW